MKKKSNGILPLILWILLCEVIGIAGSFFTMSQIPTWYQTLVKPSFSPPNWIFGPVWTLLYALMGFAAYRVWSKGMKKIVIRQSISFFLFQLSLNFFWSIIFFAWHNIPFAFVEIACLWLSIAILVVRFEKIDKLAGFAMVPYLFWVSFAMVLNYNLWILNA